jgi:hypothetical protein
MTAPAQPDPSRSGRSTAAVRATRFASGLAIAAAAVAALQFVRPDAELITAPFAPATAAAASVPVAIASPNAFGKSGQVKVRFSLPGEAVEYPLAVTGDPSALTYQWVRLVDSLPADVTRPLAGTGLVAPTQPGFYQLAVTKGESRRLVDGLTLAVMVPFSQKLGNTLNGYRIGMYVAERLRGGRGERPDGFVEIRPENRDVQLTKHLRVSDFLTHDDQRVWPRYAAVNPRLLDKLELVMNEIEKLRGEGPRVKILIDVHSGFRTPLHNHNVEGAARDSRHQYGDAADVTIDADGDGKFTRFDSRIVAMAVERVEQLNPELAGGMGLYLSRRFAVPYVHIDARGQRARWGG